ncbi:serine hydrolase [Patescibacteria group bacterium]|nr:serine hydrolase [Patescibacteria group bacterium]MBU4367823.1 serine hydrolase [Patescibacteria group bacterium]MBU4461533.1 serine hydrolase [Patescibacteria group bacterium]MCG2700326.1 serine hydrolase [Candidatus Parcubacteria bacterium]
MISFKSLIRPIIYFLVLLTVFLIVWLLVINYGEGFREIFSAKTNLQASLIGGEILLSEKEVNIPQNLRPTRDWSVEDLRFGAKAAICVETNLLNNNKVLFKKNENEQLPIASLTKLMTVLVVLENYDYDLDQVTVVSEAAVNQPGEQGLLTVNENLSIKNLLYIMLIESSNDAAYALAEVKGVEKFVDLMNLKAMELGLFSSNFVDVAGLSSDNYSTAEDLVRLTKYLLKNNPLVWEILSLNDYRLLNPSGKLHHVLLNTNELLGKVPDIIGGKTGSTLRAKGCLLLVLKNQNNQSDLIYVILGSDERFEETQRLINWINQAYKW